MAVLVLAGTAPAIAGADSRGLICSPANIEAISNNYFPGLRITPVSNELSQNATTTLTFLIANTESAPKTLSTTQVMCRCQRRLGYPIKTGLGQCQYYWYPDSSQSYQPCQSATQEISLAPHEIKIIKSSASQYKNMACGSFELSLYLEKINGVHINSGIPLRYGSVFSNLCQDCNIAASNLYANNLNITDSIFTGIPGSGLVFFFWNYNNASSNPESKFAFQMAGENDPSFSSPVIDRVFGDLSLDPSSINQQSVLIHQDKAPDAIVYNKTYYWRVKVWDSLGISSDWAFGGLYKKIGHPNPYPAFTFSLQNTAAGSVVSFTNKSICYDNKGVAACKEYAWDFGDNHFSASGNPTHTYLAEGVFNATLRVYDDTGYYETSRAISIANMVKNTRPVPVWK